MNARAGEWPNQPCKSTRATFAQLAMRDGPEVVGAAAVQSANNCQDGINI